jgi:hypothetical protein
VRADSYDRFHEGYENIYRVLGIDSALGVSSNVVSRPVNSLRYE